MYIARRVLPKPRIQDLPRTPIGNIEMKLLRQIADFAAQDVHSEFYVQRDGKKAYRKVDGPISEKVPGTAS